MKPVLALGLGLLAMVLCAVGIHQLGLDSARVEVAAIVVVYACLSLETWKAALTSFGAGYLFDLMSGHPTGLYALVAMLTFVVCRVVVVMVDVRGPVGFALLTGFIDVLHQLFAYGMLAFTGGHAAGGPSHAALLSLPSTAVLTALGGLALYPLFHRLDLAFDREESSLLR